MGYAEIALDEVPEQSFARYSIEQIVQASHRARELVKQILAFSRQTDQELKPVRASVVVNEALKLLRASLPRTTEIHQRTIMDKDIILANPTQMHQVLINLCTNAHHAMRKKGGILEIILAHEDINSKNASKHPGLKPGSYIKLAVSDSGHGIDPEIMERIFEPYFTTKGPGWEPEWDWPWFTELLKAMEDPSRSKVSREREPPSIYCFP